MKVFAVLASLAAACFAQNAFIGAPAANTTVIAGQNITVEMDKPVSAPFFCQDCDPPTLWPSGYPNGVTGGRSCPLDGSLPAFERELHQFRLRSVGDYRRCALQRALQPPVPEQRRWRETAVPKLLSPGSDIVYQRREDCFNCDASQLGWRKSDRFV